MFVNPEYRFAGAVTSLFELNGADASLLHNLFLNASAYEEPVEVDDAMSTEAAASEPDEIQTILAELKSRQRESST